jgi:hypothetical protein
MTYFHWYLVTLLKNHISNELENKIELNPIQMLFYVQIQRLKI